VRGTDSGRRARELNRYQILIIISNAIALPIAITDKNYCSRTLVEMASLTLV